MIKINKRNIGSLNLASLPAFTIKYRGPAIGGATIAFSSPNLSIARTGIPGFYLKYIGDAATCTAAFAANTLTIARTSETAFTIVYSGEGACTYKLASNILTIAVDGTPVAELDITAVGYDTIGEVVAAIHALDDIACTIGTGVATGAASSLLTAVADAVAVTTYAAKHTPANLTYDCTQAANDTITKLVAVLDALALFTCTIHSVATGSALTTGLTALSATSIKNELILTYAATTAYDCSQAANDTLGEISAILSAIADLEVTAITKHTAVPSLKLNALSATSIMTAPLTLTYTSKVITATAYDLGDEINVAGADWLWIGATLDVNDAVNVRIHAVAKMESGGTEYQIDLAEIKNDYNLVTTALTYAEINTDADQSVGMVIPVYGYEIIQLKVSAGTAGATPGQITAVNYAKWSD